MQLRRAIELASSCFLVLLLAFAQVAVAGACLPLCLDEAPEPACGSCAESCADDSAAAEAIESHANNACGDCAFACCAEQPEVSPIAERHRQSVESLAIQVESSHDAVMQLPPVRPSLALAAVPRPPSCPLYILSCALLR